MNEVTQFQFEDSPVRTMTDDLGEVWFVVRDVCEVLEIDKHRDAISRLDDDERGSVKVDTPGGPQNMAAVSESGLYTLIIRSNKPQAKPFRRWVTHDVLPAIRKTGSYGIPGAIENIPPGKILVSAGEIMELYRDTKALLVENNRLLRQQLDAAESKIPRRRNFTPDEDAQVIKFHKLGYSDRQIGEVIGRKKGSIHSCLRRLKAKGIYAPENSARQDATS